MTPAGESSSRRRLPPLPPSPWWGGGIKNFVLACDKAERDKAERDKAERAQTPCASESLHLQEEYSPSPHKCPPCAAPDHTAWYQGSMQVVRHGSRRQASAQMVHPDTKGVHEDLVGPRSLSSTNRQNTVLPGPFVPFYYRLTMRRMRKQREAVRYTCYYPCTRSGRATHEEKKITSRAGRLGHHNFSGVQGADERKVC